MKQHISRVCGGVAVLSLSLWWAWETDVLQTVAPKLSFTYSLRPPPSCCTAVRKQRQAATRVRRSRCHEGQGGVNYLGLSGIIFGARQTTPGRHAPHLCTHDLCILVALSCPET